MSDDNDDDEPPEAQQQPALPQDPRLLRRTPEDVQRMSPIYMRELEEQRARDAAHKEAAPYSQPGDDVP